MEAQTAEDEKLTEGGLSSERREDAWALLLAALVLILSIAAPDAIHTFFKEILFVF